MGSLLVRVSCRRILELFDEANDKGAIHWYDTSAYSSTATLQHRMEVISNAYNQLSRSRLDYVKFYMDSHEYVPTWIMIKVINFSTFIDILKYSKKSVTHSICHLYDLKDKNNHPHVKLLIGSLHWMRQVRNSCAHNERIYCMVKSSNPKQGASRISERYLPDLDSKYMKEKEQKIMDLIVYFKYYLPSQEFGEIINELRKLLLNLKTKLQDSAFRQVRNKMGIIDLEHLEELRNATKEEINYNKFDTF